MKFNTESCSFTFIKFSCIPSKNYIISFNYF
nr:MAG TPA: hypothetical protein [Crassvirales sp.]